MIVVTLCFLRHVVSKSGIPYHLFFLFANNDATPQKRVVHFVQQAVNKMIESPCNFDGNHTPVIPWMVWKIWKKKLVDPMTCCLQKYANAHFTKCCVPEIEGGQDTDILPLQIFWCLDHQGKIHWLLFGCKEPSHIHCHLSTSSWWRTHSIEQDWDSQWLQEKSEETTASACCVFNENGQGPVGGFTAQQFERQFRGGLSVGQKDSSLGAIAIRQNQNSKSNCHWSKETQMPECCCNDSRK